MKQTKEPAAADFIVPLNMNGLQGRMLRLPAAKSDNKRELLIVYGHHAKLERWWGLIQNFNEFGNVTMPDLPGFGGMDSFYKIGQKPSIDNLADYLASFIKLRYKRRRLTIVGISFGFVIATRMLQRYPELAKRVDMVISCVGFAHHDDFTFSKPRMHFYRTLVRLISLPGITPINVATKGDYYFDARVVEQHLRIIFNDYTGMELDLSTHAPSVVATKREAAVFIPKQLRKMLHDN
jgi:pimeloyl-ACP methyl ester carboxylesterase